jgi:hypothetical protein
MALSAEDPAVVALRSCLYEQAGRDHAALRKAVMRCATEVRERLPPEALIKVVREELPALATKYSFDYWQVKAEMVSWLLTAYYGPKDDPGPPSAP